MNKSAMWKWLLLAGLTVWSLALVTPFKEKIKLGLDLRGGTSFTVEVDRDEIRKQVLENDTKLDGAALESAIKEKTKTTQGVALEVIRGRVDGLGIAEPEIYPLLDDRIVIRLPGVDENKRVEAKNSIMSVAFLEFRLVHAESDAWVNELFSSDLAPKGFSIARTGNDRFYVRDRKAVDDKAIDRLFWEELKRFGNKRGAEFMMEKETLRDGSTVYKPAYIETRKQNLDGSALKDSRVEYDQYNRAYISLSFNKKGAERFGKITAAYAPRGENNLNSDVGRRLAIILDGKLRSAPTIQDAIYGGNAQITGSFTAEEAQQVVNVLRAGALPTPVKIIEERTVDPSLGKDSIDSGMRACIYGAIAVVVFMAAYYLLAGVVADISLILLVLMLPFGMWFSSGVLSLFSSGASAGLPVLTLPGIAGIVLTIGMAVDANVLIYERMREELALGKSVINSISAGYEKAFSTIFDSNLTTLLAAVIMFWQGSGSIRGFAVALTAGILVSMLTALVFTRLLLDTLAEKTKIKTIKMFSFFPKTNIDFMGKRYIAIGLSWAVIIASWVVLIHKGEKNFGVDFTGGTSITFAFDQKQPAEAVRAVLEKEGIKDAAIQYHGELGVVEGGKGKETLEVKVSYENGATAVNAIKTAFTAQGYKDIANDSVGPQIGEELKKKGTMSMLLALLGITIYIAFRFEFGFAIGAIVATVHDVLITIGLYCLLGRELNLTIIAALLTIIGFSVNDTIVVFDRIRENIKLMHGTKASYAEISNLSINQTLSRTVLTSLTVVITVVALLLFGGGAIFDFALTLLIGFTVGTYSSIYVATPVALLWHRDARKKD